MEYGIIGNCKSAALIDRKGTVVWCCLPDFDSASTFASMLDEERGGSFGIEVDGGNSPQRPGAQVVVVSGDRRDHGGGDDLVAGGVGRGTQLGLPVLLDP